jgi:hypothetical protein
VGKDRVLGFTVDSPLVAESKKGKTHELKPLKKVAVSRGGKGVQFWRKDNVNRIVLPPVEVPQLPAPETNGHGASKKEMN